MGQWLSEQVGAAHSQSAPSNSVARAGLSWIAALVTGVGVVVAAVRLRRRTVTLSPARPNSRPLRFEGVISIGA